MNAAAYDGRVSVNGPAQTRELAGMTISKLAVGPMDNNAYLLRCRRSGAALLIDAAAEPDRLLELVGNRLDLVLTTHRHADHWQGLARLVQATGAITCAGEHDADELPVPVARRVQDGDVLQVGEAEVSIISLVGHTPGSVAVRYDDPGGSAHLFTGDSLFPGGVGKTWSPADFTQLLHDVQTKVFDVLADDTWVYPGHGWDTTLGTERPALPEWRAREW